jgi:hypothetical protein
MQRKILKDFFGSKWIKVESNFFLKSVKKMSHVNLPKWRNKLVRPGQDANLKLDVRSQLKWRHTFWVFDTFLLLFMLEINHKDLGTSQLVAVKTHFTKF